MADDTQAPIIPDQLAQGPQGGLTQDQLQQMSSANARDQAALTPPSNRPDMPALVSLIGQMIRPTAQVQPGMTADQLARPSRMDSFEHFLGNFITSFATGMQEGGHGPGANARGFGAAVMAPLQQNRQQFELNQQAASVAAQRQQAAAQTQLAQTEAQKTGVEAQLLPQQMLFNEQMKQMSLDLENKWRMATANLGQEKVDLAKQHDAWEKELQTQSLALKKQLGEGRLNIQQEVANYQKMNVASQITYRGTVAETLQEKVGIAKAALDSMNTLRTAQSIADYQKAYNDVGVMANLARSIGIGPSADQVVSFFPNPVALPKSGGKPSGGPPGGPKSGGSALDKLKSKYPGA